MIALLLALQESAATTRMPVLPDIRFDLARTKPSPSSGNDIVVTGRRRNMRLEPLPEGFEVDESLRAGMSVLGGGMTLDVVPTILPNGIPSNRLMLTWKMKF